MKWSPGGACAVARLESGIKERQTMPEGREIEIKIALASAQDHARLLEALGEPRRRLRQHNVFLDGPDSELIRAGIGMRVREETDVRASAASTILTVKMGGGTRGDVHDHDEYETVLDGSFAETRADLTGLRELDVEPIRALRARVGLVPALRELGGFTNERSVYDVDGLVWEVDRTTFTGTMGELNEIVEHEVEIELDDHDQAEAATANVRAKLDALGVATGPAISGKYARFRMYCLGG
jgi:adenylate cyclase class IV